MSGAGAVADEAVAELLAEGLLDGLVVFGGGALEREAGPDDAGKGGYLLIGHRGRFSAT